MTICRVWRGWTTPDNASAYQELVWGTVIPEMIEARGIPELRDIDLMRRDVDGEVEFAVVMWFDNLEGVKRLAGEDWEASYVPAAARAVLSRFEERATHYEVLDRRPQPER